MNFAAAFRARLVAVSAVTSLVAKYPVDSSDPAIFTADRVPEDAVAPFVWVQPIAGAGEIANKTGRTDQVFGAVGVYDEETGSCAEVDALADAVFDALDHAPLTFAGAAVAYVVSCGRPVAAPVGDRLVGRVLQVRLQVFDP